MNTQPEFITQLANGIEDEELKERFLFNSELNHISAKEAVNIIERSIAKAQVIKVDVTDEQAVKDANEIVTKLQRDISGQVFLLATKTFN